MVFVAYLVVAVTSLISGGFAIPIGFSLGLEPIETYLAATIGSMVGLIIFLYAGDKVRDRLMRGGESSEPASDSRIREIADRHGAKGLGLIGPLFPGVTASVLIGLALGMRRVALAKWLSIGVAVMFALYTAGLWLLIEIVGVE